MIGSIAPLVIGVIKEEDEEEEEAKRFVFLMIWEACGKLLGLTAQRRLCIHSTTVQYLQQKRMIALISITEPPPRWRLDVSGYAGSVCRQHGHGGGYFESGCSHRFWQQN